MYEAHPSLQVAGLVKLSLCDWPDHLVATVFLQGCPWNCTYCHNPDLIPTRTEGSIAWEEVMAFLRTRVGLLDGVVFTGGEATRQDLRQAVGEVRDLGLKIGLHTSGAYPSRFAAILPSVDWVGFDIKALPKHAARITGVNASGRRMAESLRILLDSGVDYQVRTTWGPGVMSRDEAKRIREWARSQGVRTHVLQDVRPNGARAEFVQAYREEVRLKAP